jgi:hypothetical protein
MNNGPTNLTPSRYRKNKDGSVTEYIKRKDMSGFNMTLKEAKEVGAYYEYMQAFREAKDIEIELTPKMKNADMEIIPHHFKLKPNTTRVLIDPMSNIVRDIFEMRNHYLFNDSGFIMDWCKLDNAAINRCGPSTIPIHSISKRKTRK